MKIYKFMSLNRYCCDNQIIPNKYTELCIKSQKVFFNDWEKLNDPMEGFYIYTPEQHKINIEQILHAEKLKYKIFCCSKEYNEILMWSHYADNHRGICLEIEIDEMVCKEQNIFYRNIVYKKNLVSILPKISEQKQAKYILNHKISNWRYEKEIRFFIQNDKPNSYKIGDIKAILLGSRCNESEKNSIKEWIKNTQIELKNVEFSHITNKIEITNATLGN